jgi:hypothetical protein
MRSIGSAEIYFKIFYYFNLKPLSVLAVVAAPKIVPHNCRLLPSLYENYCLLMHSNSNVLLDNYFVDVQFVVEKNIVDEIVPMPAGFVDHFC